MNGDKAPVRPRAHPEPWSWLYMGVALERETPLRDHRRRPDPLKWLAALSPIAVAALTLIDHLLSHGR